jgi:hypothetical protein
MQCSWLTCKSNSGGECGHGAGEKKMEKKMTENQLAQLRKDLLRLYEAHHPQMTAADEAAVSQVREFIYVIMGD